MPLTPFHMGAACAVKAVTGGLFSMTVFGFAQVAMDLEPLYHLLRGEGIIHGFSHTLLGATLIAGVTIFAGRPLCQLLLNFWTPDPGDPFLNWLRGPRVISWRSAIVAACLGTYSHVLLDSMVSVDVLPFAPFAQESPLYGLVSMGALYLLLIGTGILGMLGMVIVYVVESPSRK
jgi:membrane-bound metal-dependent hydrolase YbcI (DUF457 family)